jgi:hypothetical protein
MVADSNITDTIQKWKCTKVELIDGTFYAAAGDAVDGEKFYEWIRKGRRGRKPKLDEQEFNALALNKTGLYWFDNKLHPLQMKEPFAIGSGAIGARCLMKAGIDIVRAVEIVCEVDAGSALPAQIYRVADIEEKKQ